MDVYREIEQIHVVYLLSNLYLLIAQFLRNHLLCIDAEQLTLIATSFSICWYLSLVFNFGFNAVNCTSCLLLCQ